jgi:hypothetical protein
VDSLRQPAEVRVEGANDNACVVRRSVAMHRQKMAPVVLQENPLVRGGECQNFRVRHGSIRPSSIQRGQHIMPQTPEFRDDLQRNVFVGIEAGH